MGSVAQALWVILTHPRECTCLLVISLMELRRDFVCVWEEFSRELWIQAHFPLPGYMCLFVSLRPPVAWCLDFICVLVLIGMAHFLKKKKKEKKKKVMLN